MNGLNISENIVRLRRDKGITQEELAAFIGVTKTSVSKWETGTTIPDVTILPLLATFFDVTIDQLVGYDPQLSKEQIKYYYHKLADEFAERPFLEVMRESEELTKRYYSCYPFLYQMALLWVNHVEIAPDEEVKNNVRDNIMSLCNRIMDNCKDVCIYNNTRALKGLMDLQNGHADRVVELFEGEKMEESRTTSTRNLLTLAYITLGKMEEAERNCHIGIYCGLMEMLYFGQHLLTVRARDKEYSMEVIKRLEVVMEAFRVVHLNPNLVADYSINVALELCENMSETDDEMQEVVKRNIEQYIAAIKSLSEDNMQYKDAFFRTMEDGFTDMDFGMEGVRNSKLILENAIEMLKAPIFEKLKDKDCIKIGINRLEQMRESD